MVTTNEQRGTRRFARRAERVLRRSGWYPRRAVAADFPAELKRCGWEIVPPALRFLEEFSGLEIRGREFRFLGVLFGATVTYARLGPVAFDLSSGAIYDEARAEMSRISPCTPIGDVREYGQVFLMDAGGQVFGWLPEDPPAYKWLWRIALSGDRFIDCMCTGRRQAGSEEPVLW